MKIAIGSDHAGYVLKQAIATWLIEQGHDVLDLGTDSTERCDYPAYGAAVGHAVAGGQVQFGIAVCGSGEGICMA
ncbi:MAG: RpiB/LacA/LacB family sugar-phosphate isomerase, partial [Actinomycetales bacterium]